MTQPDPNQKPEDIPLVSPMPHSSTMDNEEPELANEEDVGTKDSDGSGD